MSQKIKHAAADREAVVLAMEALDERHRLLTIEATGHLADFRAGQFAMLRCRPPLLLRRPLSLQRRVRVRSGEAVEILFRIVGEGTADLARLRPGDRVGCLGPLGRGFTLPGPEERAVLLGGGVGIPPMVALDQAIARAGLRRPLVVGGVGGRDDAACLAGLRDARGELHLATMDGSEGVRGTVLDALERIWGGAGAPPGTRLYACGPVPMLAAVGRLAAARELPCQLSVEAVMGCGFGACVGCAVPRSAAAARREGGRFALACQDGPAFDAADLDLDGLSGVV